MNWRSARAEETLRPTACRKRAPPLLRSPTRSARNTALVTIPRTRLVMDSIAGSKWKCAVYRTPACARGTDTTRRSREEKAWRDQVIALLETSQAHVLEPAAV